MTRRLLTCTAVAAALMLLVGPLAGVATADKGGVPRSDHGHGKPADGGAGRTESEGSSAEEICDGDSGGHSTGGQGANTDGEDNPYHNTCNDDGSSPPSANGNGGGQATGRPDSGSVGQADDKNPPGQQPGPSDANNGYECDGNKGIGRGNPAHTGCRSSVPTSPPAPESVPPQEPGPAEEVVVAEQEAQVLGVKLVQGAALARTGVDSDQVALAAIALLGLGAGLLAWERRRHASSESV